MQTNRKELIMINIIKRIDGLRKERGWSIYRLSIKTGLTQQAIHAWYDTKKPTMPSIATLDIVCSAFGITLMDFFMEKNFIEVTPPLKKLYDSWRALSKKEQSAIELLINTMLKKKN